MLLGEGERASKNEKHPYIALLVLIDGRGLGNRVKVGLGTGQQISLSNGAEIVQDRRHAVEDAAFRLRHTCLRMKTE